MTKDEFIRQLANDDRFESQKAASEAVEAVLDAISDALASGEEINFTGFGKFTVNERSSRQGVNPSTGERITIAARRIPKFSAGAALKRNVGSLPGGSDTEW